MQIDWITTLAQILNFLVLVFLLQRFLYKPVLRAIEQRQQRIQDQLDGAEETRREAEAEVAAYRAKQAELEAQRETFLSEAREAAAVLQTRLEHEARTAMDEQRDAWRKDLEAERDAFLADVQRRAGAFAVELGRKALADLADADLNTQAVQRFLVELDGLEEQALADFTSAAGEGDGLVIETAFDLEAPIKRALTRKLHERLGETFTPIYARAEDLLFGIRLRAGTHALEWSLAGFMEDLEGLLDFSAAEAGAGQPKSKREAA